MTLILSDQYGLSLGHFAARVEGRFGWSTLMQETK